jgi:predicted deacetylase
MCVGGRRLSWEFGREVDYATQRKRIASGRAIMTEKLGPAFDGRMFTPPRHRFNADTVRAAAAEGFDIFSAAAYVDRPRRLVYAVGKLWGIGSIRNRGVAYHPGQRPEAVIQELSIAIAMDHGVPRSRRLADILDEIDRAAQVSPVVGLMFHHAAWQSADDHRFLGDLADALLARSDTQLALPRDIAGR